MSRKTQKNSLPKISRRHLLKKVAAIGGGAALVPLIAGKSRGESTNNRSAADDLKFVLVGSVTVDSVVLKMKIDNTNYLMRVKLSYNSDLSNHFYSPYYAEIGNPGVKKVWLTNLQSNRKHYFAIEINGELNTTLTGSFRTFNEAPFHFKFAFASCARSRSNHAVFDAIRLANPLFFIHMGDMHYENINQDSFAAYRAAYDEVLSMPRQARLFRNVPLVYTWDDHDFCGNNSDSTSEGRTAVRLTYQEYFPHYPLVQGSGDVPIYQAFTVGRVRFLLTDTRSMRTPSDYPDDENKTMLGTSQLNWLKQEFLDARETYPVIVWINTIPWIGGPEDDHWGHYTTERRNIGNFIKDNDIKGIIMVSGDAHMVAIDNGAHSDYANGGGGGFPVIQAASLDQSGSVKGGPYTEGHIMGRGHFGTVEIFDNGGSAIVVHLACWNSVGTRLIHHYVTMPAFDIPRAFLPILKK
jgi:alkaline phosphatase D